MTGSDYYNKAKRIIPGGTQLLSKRPEMFLPNNWPSYFTSARGIQVTDLNDNVLSDWIMGVGPCVLGYADPDVNAAVIDTVAAGTMCTLNCPEEVELAELLCNLHPWAQMVRYARSGGEAMSIAVRIARAYTGRDIVAFCGYHGWCDWYLAANLGNSDQLAEHLLPGIEPLGVPRSLAGSAVSFPYNGIEQLQSIAARHKADLAAIVMEPQRGDPPQPGFLEGAREVADTTGAVLIFDEITTGVRSTSGGIHLLLGVNPDLAVFAKAMSNGYPMSAIIGTEQVMQAAQSSFISSTNWTERVGPVAALATIRKHRRENVGDHLTTIGNAVGDGWREAAENCGLRLHVSGMPALIHFSLEYENELELVSLFTQCMLERGYLACNWFKPSFAHKRQDVVEFLRTVSDVFAEVAAAVQKGNARQRLKGPPALRGFFRVE